MTYLVLAIIASFGLLCSLILHIATFFSMSDVWISLGLLLGAFALVLPDWILLPIPLPSYKRAFRSQDNLWRLIPSFWRNVLIAVFAYAIISFVVIGLFFAEDGHLPPPYGSRVVTAIAASLYALHVVLYWFHAPSSDRKRWINAVSPPKRSERHHGKDTRE